MNLFEFTLERFVLGWFQFGTETEKAEMALYKQVESTI